jgi:hypothetical protein
MKKNPIYQALSIILRNTGKSLPILKYGLIENGWLRMTDLEHEIRIYLEDYGKKPVLADIGLQLKVNDMSAAIDAAQIMNVNDFPGQIDPGQQAVNISPKVLDGLIDLLPAVSTDDSRGCLRSVFVNRKKKEAVATDGHICLVKKLSVGPMASFMIDPITLKIAECFTGNLTGLTIHHRLETKGTDGTVSTHSADYLTLTGNGWQLVSRVLPAKDYPMYWRAIPDRSQAVSVVWDKGLIGEVSAFLDKAKPFTNPKTHLIHLIAGEGIVKNDSISFFRRTVFARDILPLKPEQVIGVNAEILQSVLKFIQDRPVAVTVGEHMINAIVFQGEDCLALVMPLRTSESSAGITRAELLKEEGGKAAVIPALGNQMRKAA